MEHENINIVDPVYEIQYIQNDLLKRLESIARVCYKSEDKISLSSASAKKLLKSLIDNGHEAMIEHSFITIKFIHNRGFSHEIVRHRIASFAQESTRYCNYSKDKFGNKITVIKPYWFCDNTNDEKIKNAALIWLNTMKYMAKNYFSLIKDNVLQAQAARGVLPNDLKTEIIVTANLREWRQIFKLRTTSAAHPDMQRIMRPLLKDLQSQIPIIFDDLKNY